MEEFLKTVENNYKETHDSQYSYLTVILTQMNTLKSDERYSRAKLCKGDNSEDLLEISCMTNLMNMIIRL